MTAIAPPAPKPRPPSCPPKPPEQHVEWVETDGVRRCVYVETDAEKLARVRANVAYYSHPDAVVLSGTRFDQLLYWEMFEAELADRGVS